MDLPTPDAARVARAIEFSLDAARWERDAEATTDADDRFSHRIRAEISRLKVAAALRDIGL